MGTQDRRGLFVCPRGAQQKHNPLGGYLWSVRVGVGAAEQAFLPVGAGQRDLVSSWPGWGCVCAALSPRGRARQQGGSVGGRAPGWMRRQIKGSRGCGLLSVRVCVSKALRLSPGAARHPQECSSSRLPGLPQLHMEEAARKEGGGGGRNPPSRN